MIRRAVSTAVKFFANAVVGVMGALVDFSGRKGAEFIICLFVAALCLSLAQCALANSSAIVFDPNGGIIGALVAMQQLGFSASEMILAVVIYLQHRRIDALIRLLPAAQGGK